MKISVVIPAHNEEKYIAKTLEAVLKQDYSDFEVIVVDNASTDRTYEIASSFPVRVVSENRKGILLAREKGRLEAKGIIIANLDADCLPEKNWLSSAVARFEDTDVVAVTGPYDYYNSSEFSRNFLLLVQKYIYSFLNDVFLFFHFNGILTGGNNLIRSNALEVAGGYNTTILFYGEDTDIAKRVSSFGKIDYSRHLIMKTSARRLQAEGLVKVTSFYLYYFFKTSFFTPSKRRKS